MEIDLDAPIDEAIDEEMLEEQDPDQVLKDKLKRRGKRQIAKETGGNDDQVIANITEKATLGLPERFTIVDGDPKEGTEPLRLYLRAPVIDKGEELYAQILTLWPDVFLGAALSSPNSKGVNIRKVAEFWHEKDSSLSEEVVIAAVKGELTNFTRALFRYGQPDQANTPHILDELCDTIWPLANGYNEGLTREDLPRRLKSRLRPENFADLLRAVIRACCGCDEEYEDDVRSRFVKPSELPEQKTEGEE